MRSLFKDVDLIITPTTGITAPEIEDGALDWGVTDYPKSGNAMKYAFLANFLGLPAVSCPIGTDGNGMPIGVQFQARWWNEALLLKIAAIVEGVYATRLPPQVSFNVLER